MTDPSTRLGPLSYSVESASGETSAERAIVTSLVVGVGLFVAGLIVSWVVLGVTAAGRVVTWGVPATILLATIGSALVVSRGSMARTRRNALLASGAAAVFVSLIAFQVVGSYKPAMPQVKQMLDELRLPPGFAQVYETTSGDRFCRRGCPTVKRRYTAPATDADPVSTFVLAMVDQGWRPTNDVEPALATVVRRGDVIAQLGENEPHVVYLTAARSTL